MKKSSFSYSKRLNFIADFISPCRVLADIGTDHAYIPIRLIKTGKIKQAIACDINKGPLKKSESNIKQYNLEASIQVRLADGMSKINYAEADTVLIAGMGADLMMKILDEGEAIKPSVQEYVLSPQSKWRQFRHYLNAKGYVIKEEGMVFDEGKYYLVIKAVPDTCKEEPAFKAEASGLSEIYETFGLYLIKTKDAVLKEYLKREYRLYSELLEKLLYNKEKQYGFNTAEAIDNNKLNNEQSSGIALRINEIKQYIALIQKTERIMR